MDDLEIFRSYEKTGSGLDFKFNEILKKLKENSKINSVTFEFNSVPFTITEDFDREKEKEYYRKALDVNRLLSDKIDKTMFSKIIKNKEVNNLQMFKKAICKNATDEVFYNKLENNFKNLFGDLKTAEEKKSLKDNKDSHKGKE